MNRTGPLVSQLTASVDDAGLIVVSGIVPGPAGLARSLLAEGSVTIDVDVAEPANLVALHYPPGDFDRWPVQPVLTAMFDRLVVDELRALDVDRIGPDGVVVWQGDRPPPGAPSSHLRLLAHRTGELGQVGRLVLATGELTRTERSPLGIAIGLAEAAGLADTLGQSLGPQPDAPSLTDAAMRHLQQWQPNRSTGPTGRGGNPAEAWIDRLEPRHRQVLHDLLERLARRLRLQDVTVAEALDTVIARLRRSGSRHPSGDDLPDLPMAAGTAPAMRSVAESAGAFDDDGVSAARLSDLAKLPSRVFPIAMPAAAKLDAPRVLVDPALERVQVTSTRVADGHLLVKGRGQVDDEAWLRLFEPGVPAGSAPILVAMAPLRATGIGRWAARILQPGDTDLRRALADLTPTPRDPWRSPPLRAAVAATDLGAAAARASRRGDPDAADRWDAVADAWTRAGDPNRAITATRLAEAADDPAMRANRADLTTGPLATDLVE